jgi:hypothetical protein
METDQANPFVQRQSTYEAELFQIGNGPIPGKRQNMVPMQTAGKAYLFSRVCFVAMVALGQFQRYHGYRTACRVKFFIFCRLQVDLRSRQKTRFLLDSLELND